MVNEPYRIVIYIHVNLKFLNEFQEMVRTMYDVAEPNFWCELGYQDDKSNETEENFIPFYIVIPARTKENRDLILEGLEKVACIYLFDSATV